MVYTINTFCNRNIANRQELPFILALHKDVQSLWIFDIVYELFNGIIYHNFLVPLRTPRTIFKIRKNSPGFHSLITQIELITGPPSSPQRLYYVNESLCRHLPTRFNPSKSQKSSLKYLVYRFPSIEIFTARHHTTVNKESGEILKYEEKNKGIWWYFSVVSYMIIVSLCYAEIKMRIVGSSENIRVTF